MLSKAHLVKGLLYPLEWGGRKFLFNRRPPVVGKVISSQAYGGHPDQILDIYTPPGAPPYPVLVYLHGGGFLLGSKDTYGRIARSFAHAGYLTFNVNYRLAPAYRYPVHIQDAALAIAWAFDRSRSYGGDPFRLFLAGDSAGAMLTSWYAAALTCPRLFEVLGIQHAIPRHALRGILLFYGLYDFETVLRTKFPFISTMTGSFLGTDRRDYAQRAEIVSPLRHLTPHFPPVFLCAGEKDSLFSESVAFRQALQTKGIPHETLFFFKEEFPEADHGFLFFYKKCCAIIAMREAKTFMARLAAD